MSKKPGTYEVTLRRDVQQVARVRVVASSKQEAIDVAESVVDNAASLERADALLGSLLGGHREPDAWSIEEHIGTHRPQVQIQSNAPIKGRKTGKADRRADIDRRANKRRLGDKSRALVAARNSRKERV